MKNKKPVFNTLYLIIVPLALYGAFQLFTFSNNYQEGKDKDKEKTPSDMNGLSDEQYRQEFRSRYAVFAPPIPAQLNFAGEKVPVEYYDVRESLDKEILINTYWHSTTLAIIKRANKYFPIIEPILKEKGVPEDFKYMAIIESGLQNVASPVGAKGYWQFMKSTAQKYGLEVSEQVDERMHIEKATRAACQYLKDHYRIYGDWALTAASYNTGAGNINRYMEEQRTESYWDLAMNEETGRFVYRILAAKLIHGNPRNYGFHYREKDLYHFPPVKIVEVDSTINDLVAFAKEQGINYKTLLHLNPWLLKKSLEVKGGKVYQLKIPVDGIRTIPAEMLED